MRVRIFQIQLIWQSKRLPSSLADSRWYEPVTIKKDTYFENFFSFVKWITRRELSLVGEPVDKDRWLMTPQTWNAYYNPPGNEVFPSR